MKDWFTSIVLCVGVWIGGMAVHLHAFLPTVVFVFVAAFITIFVGNALVRRALWVAERNGLRRGLRLPVSGRSRKEGTN